MGDKYGWKGFSLMYVTGLENNLEEVDHAWNRRMTSLQTHPPIYYL
jgi:hypothetical protein